MGGRRSRARGTFEENRLERVEVREWADVREILDTGARWGFIIEGAEVVGCENLRCLSWG